jgi:hypothetical protein
VISISSGGHMSLTRGSARPGPSARDAYPKQRGGPRRGGERGPRTVRPWGGRPVPSFQEAYLHWARVSTTGGVLTTSVYDPKTRCRVSQSKLQHMRHGREQVLSPMTTVGISFFQARPAKRDAWVDDAQGEHGATRAGSPPRRNGPLARTLLTAVHPGRPPWSTRSGRSGRSARMWSSKATAPRFDSG